MTALDGLYELARSMSESAAAELAVGATGSLTNPLPSIVSACPSCGGAIVVNLGGCELPAFDVAREALGDEFDRHVAVVDAFCGCGWRGHAFRKARG